MSVCLVTGGAGFIGSHVVDALVSRGDSVRVVDDLSTGSRENLTTSSKIEFVQADLADPGVAKTAVDGVEMVVHLAAIPSVPRSVQEPARTHRANVEATQALLLASRDANVRRVVQASSSSIYGESETLPKHEGMQPSPLSPYALHKLIAEQYASLYTRLYGLETVSLRFFNVFGPRQSPGSQYSGVISLFTAALLEGRSPTIYGDGGQTRDFTYVSDIVNGILSVIEHPFVEDNKISNLTPSESTAKWRVLNIGRGEKVELMDFVRCIEKYFNKEINKEFLPLQAGDIPVTFCNTDKLKNNFSYDPSVSVEEGVKHFLDWYVEYFKVRI